MTCIIIDDEAFARENLKMFVDDFCPELEVLGLAASANDGLELIDQHQPDVVFLDVMMPEATVSRC